MGNVVLDCLQGFFDDFPIQIGSGDGLTCGCRPLERRAQTVPRRSNGARDNSATPPALEQLRNSFSSYVAHLGGKFNATVAGNYTFQTRSDDGSAVFIDGAAIVDNNRQQAQATRTDTTHLSKGLHDIVIAYYQGNNAAGFSVGVTLPDQGQSFTLGNELNLPNSLLTYGGDVLTIGSLSFLSDLMLQIPPTCARWLDWRCPRDS